MSTTGYSQWFRPSTGGGPTSFSACRIYVSTNTQTLSSGVGQQPIAFDASDLDTDGYADLAHNRIVIPTGKGGWFYCTTRLSIAPVTNGGLSDGNAALFLLTVADGLRDYQYSAWQQLTTYYGYSDILRTLGAQQFADGEAIYCDFQDATTGSDIYLFGDTMSAVSGVAPRTYLEIWRMGDA